MPPFACTYVCKLDIQSEAGKTRHLDFHTNSITPVQTAGGSRKCTEGAFAYNLGEFVYAGAGNVRFMGQIHIQAFELSMQAVTVQKSFTITIGDIWKVMKHITNFACVKKGHRSQSNILICMTAYALH